MSTVTDATGREIDVFCGEVGDEAVALVVVRAQGSPRQVVSLWLCAEQIEALVVAMRERQREAVDG